jgi:Flp pilus assembly protein protease CpaA
MLENVVAFALMTPQQILGDILTIIIGAVLFHASLEDIRRRDISSLHVIVLFILACFYIILTGSLGLETTYLFLFVLILFISISAVSKGGFGMGDSLVISALALFFHDFTSFQTFLYAMGLISIPWVVYYTLKYRKDTSLKGLMHGFRAIVPIDKVQVGDVIYGDNFMHGLTQPQINKYKLDGYISLEIKKVMPYVPVIFMAFIITLLI